MSLQRSIRDRRAVARYGPARAAGRSERASLMPCPVFGLPQPLASDCSPKMNRATTRGQTRAAEWSALVTKKSRDCAAAAAASSTSPLAHLFRPPGVSTTARPAVRRAAAATGSPRSGRRQPNASETAGFVEIPAQAYPQPHTHDVGNAISIDAAHVLCNLWLFKALVLLRCKPGLGLRQSSMRNHD
jgi:hypothetical protein